MAAALRIFTPLLPAALAALGVFSPALGAEHVSRPERPFLENLGDQRYRIGGRIEVDKARQSFTVPGVVIDLGPENMPLEFLVIAKGGVKAYESLLEMDANALEFNLACILVGLSARNAVPPRRRFDPAPVEGDRVALWVSWEENGRAFRKKISELIQMAGQIPVSDEWAYTGSFFFRDNQYAAQALGLLVGFVHHPASIIQHRSGLGLGNYGAVTYRRSAGPPPGSSFLLTVERLAQ